MITSKKTDKLLQRLENEYTVIQKKAKMKGTKIKPIIINIGKRATLERDLLESIRVDFHSPKQNHLRTL